MSPVIRWLCWAILSGLLASCAHRSEPQPDTLAGRIAVRIEGQAERSLNAGFELSGSARQGSLVLSGPLGATAAQAHWTAREAWLITERGRVDYPDLDTLTAAALGESIPVAALFAWLRGQPWAEAPNAARDDGVAGFDQLGWRIDLSRWSERWIEATRTAAPAVTVRARLERT